MYLLAALSILAVSAFAAPGDFVEIDGLRIRSSAAPPPDANMKVRGLTYGGSGCPQGSQLATTTDANGNPEYHFPNLVVESGPDASLSRSRANCQMNLDIVTTGYQYRVVGKAGVDPAYMMAHVRIDTGISAYYKDTYYFSGSAAQSSVEYNITRGEERDFDALFPDPYQGFTTAWGPCGEGALNMNRQIRLLNDAGNRNLTAYFELYQGLGYIPWELFEWQKC